MLRMGIYLWLLTQCVKVILGNARDTSVAINEVSAGFQASILALQGRDAPVLSGALEAGPARERPVPYGRTAFADDDIRMVYLTEWDTVTGKARGEPHDKFERH